MSTSRGWRSPARPVAGSAPDESGDPYPRTLHRLSQRRRDIILVQQASGVIQGLGAELDRRLAAEGRPAERLELIRATTNQIIRVANDAIRAYARVSRSVRAELDRPDGDRAAASETRARLDASRAAILEVLEVARTRYAIPERPEAPPEER